MAKPIVLIGIPGSILRAELAERLEGAGHSCHALSIDAALEGKAVTVAGGGLCWEDVDLLQAGAIFVERPIFPWPQMLLPTGRFRTDLEREQWVLFQRESVSLIVSALSAAAEIRPVINPPGAAHLAVSPSIALDRLAGGGIPVHPWIIEPAPAPDRAGDGFVLDACGRDRWHAPRRPPGGEPALVIGPFEGEVVTILIVGGEPAGALRFSSGDIWAEWYQTEGNRGEPPWGGAAADEDRPEPLDDLGSCPQAAELAIRAAASLDLDIAAVSVHAGAAASSVLLCEAGPDLDAWNGILEGRVAAALADHLTSVASK